MKPNHIVFLYSEMAGYFQSSLKVLAQEVDAITVFHWPVNKEAPFMFDTIKGVDFIDRSAFDTATLTQEVSKRKPKAIVCSGWMDKGYTSVVADFKKKIPTLLIIDNHWTGSWKQRLLCLISRFKITDRFTHAWVAGGAQSLYALNLGFPKENVIEGFYSADITLFNDIWNKRKENVSYPKKFIYVGRYLKHKGIFEMWNAFVEANAAKGNEWEFWSVGTGDEFDQRMEHESITHHGFLQPSQLADLAKEAGVFVLPSTFEPWGVVVHEFAAAGFPLLLNHKVGAADCFLDDKQNGFLVDISRQGQLTKAFERFMDMSDADLFQMAKTSHDKGQFNSPRQWVDNLLHLL